MTLVKRAVAGLVRSSRWMRRRAEGQRDWCFGWIDGGSGFASWCFTSSVSLLSGRGLDIGRGIGDGVAVMIAGFEDMLGSSCDLSLYTRVMVLR